MAEIIACRPVDWSALGVMGSAVEEVLGGQAPVYAHSVESACDLCRVRIWVGPRAQAVIRDSGGAYTVCFLCMLIHAAPGTAILSLGNTPSADGN